MKTTFVQEFVYEARKFYDTPDELLETIGIFLAGCALTWKVHVMAPKELTTNGYYLVVAAPGWYHKSAPLAWGLSVLRKVVPDSTFVSSLGSAEAAYIQIAHSQAKNGIVTYDEFATFMQHVGKDYASQMLNMVVECWDRHAPMEMARTKKSKSTMSTMTLTIQEDFVFNFIASSTTAWLFGNIKKDDMDSGFLSRFLISEAHEQTRIYELPDRMPDTVDQSLMQKLRELLDYWKVKTEFFMQPDAAELYKSVYREIMTEGKTSDNHNFSNITSRIPRYMLKLSLIHAAMRLDRPVIEKNDVEWAGAIVFRAVDSYRRLLLSFSENDFQRMKNGVELFLMTSKKSTERELYRRFNTSVGRMDAVLKALAKEEKVEIVEALNKVKTVSYLDGKTNHA
ncbi:MAG: DUF3987 domain-containing protein [Candidatus Omnitrophota bacterium]